MLYIKEKIKRFTLLGDVSVKGKSFVKILIAVILIAAVGFIFYDSNYGDNKLGLNLKGSVNTVEDKADTQEAENEEEADDTIPQGSIKLEEDGRSSFVTYGKGFMHFTRDGVKFYEGIGKLSWSDVYSISSPYVVSDGEMSAVVDLLGKTAKVYDTNGLKFTVQTEENIHSAAVNSNGYLALILKGKNNYKVQLYNSAGNLKFQRFDEDEGIFPVCCDISDDNKVIAVSYTDTTDIEMLSKVLFFYTDKGESGDADAGGMYAACEVKGEIIASINYMKDNEYVCVSDKAVFSINGNGISQWRRESGNRIEKVAFSDEGYIAVAYGDEIISDAETVEVGTVSVINFGGKETGSVCLGGDVDSLYIGKYVVASSGGKYYGIKLSGKTIWEESPNRDMVGIFPLNGNSVLYATKRYAEVKNISK